MSASDVKSAGRMLRHIDDPNTRRLFELILSNVDTLKNSISELEEPESYDWFDVELKNNWVQYGISHNPPQYSITHDGIVRLRGLIKNGTTTPGTVLFTLPKTFRSEFIVLIDTISNNLIGKVDIEPSGDVVIRVGSNTWLSLDNISFQAYR